MAITSLRHNNQVALQLRDEVLRVDEQNGDVEAALRKLREHVYGHMNSNLAVQGGVYPPVQLKFTYDRLAAAEKERVSAANAQLYTQAQGYCESLIPTGRSLNRIDCIQNYITERGGATEQPIPDASYKFDFAAPAWSFDKAGWSIIGCMIVGFLLLVRVATMMWLKHLVHGK